MDVLLSVIEDLLKEAIRRQELEPNALSARLIKTARAALRNPEAFIRGYETSRRLWENESLGMIADAKKAPKDQE
jgi:hypothetical protein